MRRPNRTVACILRDRPHPRLSLYSNWDKAPLTSSSVLLRHVFPMKNYFAEVEELTIRGIFLYRRKIFALFVVLSDPMEFLSGSPVFKT